jgi:hypothetical protein
MTFSMGCGRQESGSNKCKAIRLLTCDGTMSVIEGKADFPVARPDFSV